MLLQHWGATPDEIAGPVAGDHLVTGARLVGTRCVTLDAAPSEVFAWLRQMGFGRAGWYSYDLLDNLGRRSADRIHPEWQHVETGDPVPGGPADFVAAFVDEPRAFVLDLPPGGPIRRRIAFTLAYELRPAGTGTRLVTRIRGRVDLPLGRLFERFVLGPGDGVMVRRQLLNLAARTGSSIS